MVGHRSNPRKHAVPIMGVVGHRCPHCQQPIHEKAPGKWQQASRCFVHACGGSYTIKDDSAQGAGDEPTFRGWLPVDKGHDVSGPARVALESLIRDVVIDADAEQKTVDEDQPDDVVGLSTRTYSSGKHGGSPVNRGAPSLTRRA